VTDVWSALDACDASEMGLGGFQNVALGRDLTAVARATLYWLVALDCQDLRVGMHHLRVIADDFHCASRNRVAAADGRRRVRMHPAVSPVPRVARERRSRLPNCS
jgi:hypothetical protein